MTPREIRKKEREILRETDDKILAIERKCKHDIFMLKYMSAKGEPEVDQTEHYLSPVEVRLAIAKRKKKELEDITKVLMEAKEANKNDRTRNRI